MDGFGGSIGIVGGGNVALDIARIVLDHKNLKSTDISSPFLNTIGESTDVNFFIRRGPFDLPCTTRELRELLTLPNIKVEIFGLDGIPLSQLDQYKKLQKSRKLDDRKQKRLLKVLAESESSNLTDGHRTIRFHFFHTPTEIQENSDTLSCYFNAKNEGIVMKEVNYLIESLGYNQTPIENEIEILDTSSGRGEYDKHRIYLAGWALSGAKGVVGDSTESARRACERKSVETGDEESFLLFSELVYRWRQRVKVHLMRLFFSFLLDQCSYSSRLQIQPFQIL